jgi:hypothetical protein
MRDPVPGSSIPRRMPGWVLRRPYLAVACLQWVNAFLRRRWLLPVCLVVALAIIWGATRSQFGEALEAAWSYWGFVVIGVVVYATMTALRSRAHVLAEDSFSWLAPLPVAPARMLRMTMGLLVQLAAIGVLLALSAVAGTVEGGTAGKLFLAAAFSYACGFGLGLVLKRGQVEGVPDSNYAAARHPRPHWASAPRLTPLSFWAMGQARVLIKPKVGARLALPVLLALPMGTGGEKALAIAAGTLVTVSLCGYTIAAIQVAFRAGAWLSPTPLRKGAFAVAIGSRSIPAQAAACALIIFLLAAIAPGHLIHALFDASVVFVAVSISLVTLSASAALR